MTNWTDHVIRESRRLGISYGCAMTDQRVKDSYKKLSSPKKVSPKRPKGRPKKAPQSRESPKRPKGRPKKALGISYISAVGDRSYKKPLRLKKKKVEKGSDIDEELERIEQEYAAVGAKMTKSPVIKRVSFSSNTPETVLSRTKGKKSREEISPRIIRSPTPPRKSRRSIFRNPAIRRKLFVPDERTIGIVGRKTGEKTRRVVGRDSDDFENVDEFFEQFGSE